MYNVTNAYLQALQERTTADSISGTIYLADGSTIAVNDDTLVSDTLRLRKELCGSQYTVGAFNLSCLRFSIFADNALGIDLTGASVSLTYTLFISDDSSEIVPLGTFLIDPVLSVRRRDVLDIEAYDVGVRADRPPSDTIRETQTTPDALIAAVCAECGISTDITAGSLNSFPNCNITVTPKDRQIQSCRDIIMWCSTLLCAYAVIDRSSKLVLIPAKYDVDPDDSTVIIADRTITESERNSITVTDTRAYIKYLTAYKGSEIANYTSSYVSPDEQASPAAYTLEKNPLLCDKTGEECDIINRAWLAYIDSFKQRGVNAQIFGDPAIDIGDTVMFRGGDVDQRRGVAGVITSFEWRYRDHQDIVCCAPQCLGSLVSGSQPAVSSTQTRSQVSKRIDAVSAGETTGGVGLAVGAHSEIFNGYPGDSYAANTIEDGQWGYNRVAGAGNSLTGESQCTELGGYNNSVVHAYCSIVHGNDVKLKRYGGYTPAYSIIVGETIKNYTSESDLYGKEIRDSAILGHNHYLVGRVDASIVGGRDMYTSGNGATCSLIVGQGHNISAAGWCIVGGNGATVNSTAYRLVLGGSYDNCFTVDNLGYVKAKGTYSTMGADYAEFFEWADGNPDGEDRRGMLVALDGDRIVPATGNGFFGIISASPSIVGNAAELHWKGKYMTDAFGNTLTDDDGNPVINEQYEPDMKYIPRSERPEWAAVGLVGRLTVRDDGSCKVGGYVTASDGIAKASSKSTRARVIRRKDDHHVEVLIK